jgi:LPS export ABC transporter protein LptC
MRNMIALLSIIFLITVSFFLLKKNEDKEQFVSQDSFMENVRLVHVDSDVLSWTAKLDRAMIDSIREESVIENIMFTFHKQNITAYAINGLYDMISDNLLLSDDVRATKDGLDISTDSVFWDAGKRWLRSDSHVEIRSDSFFIEGTGLSITDDGKMTLNKNIKAIAY